MTLQLALRIAVAVVGRVVGLDGQRAVEGFHRFSACCPRCASAMPPRLLRAPKSCGSMANAACRKAASDSSTRCSSRKSPRRGGPGMGPTCGSSARAAAVAGQCGFQHPLQHVSQRSGSRHARGQGHRAVEGVPLRSGVPVCSTSLRVVVADSVGRRQGNDLVERGQRFVVAAGVRQQVAAVGGASGKARQSAPRPQSTDYRSAAVRGTPRPGWTGGCRHRSAPPGLLQGDGLIEAARLVLPPHPGSCAGSRHGWATGAAPPRRVCAPRPAGLGCRDRQPCCRRCWVLAIGRGAAVGMAGAIVGSAEPAAGNIAAPPHSPLIHTMKRCAAAGLVLAPGWLPRRLRPRCCAWFPPTALRGELGERRPRRAAQWRLAGTGCAHPQCREPA